LVAKPKPIKETSGGNTGTSITLSVTISLGGLASATVSVTASTMAEAKRLLKEAIAAARNAV
jgi:hypothetical protein